MMYMRPDGFQFDEEKEDLSTGVIGVRLYTEGEIKKAFWKEFHQCGECFFDYLDSDERADASTESYWQDFLYRLKGN